MIVSVAFLVAVLAIVTLSMLGLHTDYLDDLYITERNGVFGALTLEAVFE